MSDHDPLCPQIRYAKQIRACWLCQLIEKVRADQDEKSRADERAKIATAREKVAEAAAAWAPDPDDPWCCETCERLARSDR